MQRIVCRYRREASAASLGSSELRGIFRAAAELAGMTLQEGRGVLLGPPLPADATSEAERLVLDLDTPCDPSEVCGRVNPHLPEGLALESAWLGRPGVGEENPSALDESVYDVLWHGAPSSGEIIEHVRAFLLAPSVAFTRVREKKIQQLDARALTRDIRLVAVRDGVAHVQVTVSVGPQGTLRPEEVLTALGFSPASGSVKVHRLALQSSGWQRPMGPLMAATWRRGR